MKAMPVHPYHGVTAALGTMHGKESALEGPFAKLDVKLVVPKKMNTDSLGTFTGEIERLQTPVETVKRKARMAMAELGLHYGLASEGSFGPHRLLPLIAEHEEWLVWVDDNLGIEILKGTITENTNHGSVVVGSQSDLDRFLDISHFPSHAMIVKPNQPMSVKSMQSITNESHMANNHVWKGVTNRPSLDAAIQQAQALSTDGNALICTDMRAHFNPTRMNVIEKLGHRMIERLARLCPTCKTPGWGRVSYVPGLPCETCGSETDLVEFEVYGCQLCDMTQNIPRHDGLRTAPTAQCPYCNP